MDPESVVFGIFLALGLEVFAVVVCSIVYYLCTVCFG